MSALSSGAFFFFFLCLVLQIFAKRQRQSNSLTQSDLVERLLDTSVYKSRIRPGADSGKPLDVLLHININDISSVSEVKMEFSLTMFLRQTWVDERLMYSDYNKSITLNYNQFGRIWSPDLFIRNLKAGEFHTITVPNRLIRLSPDGTVLYSQRLSLTLACDMLLEGYPMDNQTCKLDFGSYGYTTEDLIFKWKPIKMPVDVNKDISLPEFAITGAAPATCAKKYSTTGSFPCLYAYLYLKRRMQFYILQVYLPSFLIVLLSWVSFWIDLNAVPARTSLGILTILTITTQSAGVNAGLPAVSFTKAIDVWMATSLVFVFGAFLEYSVVNVLSRRHKKEMKNDNHQRIMADLLAKYKRQNNKHIQMTSFENDPVTGVHQRMLARNGGGRDQPDSELFCKRQWYVHTTWWQRAQHNNALMVDVISRIVFPTLFIGFMIVYWPMYLL